MPPNRTTVKQHRWMEMTYVPVTVVGIRDDGQPATFPVGDPILGVSCFDCLTPITSDILNTECLGEMNPDLP